MHNPIVFIEAVMTYLSPNKTGLALGSLLGGCCLGHRRRPWLGADVNRFRVVDAFHKSGVCRRSIHNRPRSDFDPHYGGHWASDTWGGGLEQAS
jgi:hypothetical protein